MQNIKNIIEKTLSSLYNSDYIPEISIAPKPEFGEYCINVFPLAKTAGKAPNIIAGEVATELAKHTEVFVSTSATGGYVNFFLTDTVWMKIFQGLNQSTNQPISQSTIVVDYIGANVGKPLHIGHICTPSIGQVICNTYRHLGYRVIGDSHFGDWGGIFGAIIYSWKFEKDIWNNELQKKYAFLEFKDESDKKSLTLENPGRFKIMNKLLESEGINYILYLYQQRFQSAGPTDLINGDELEKIRQEKDSQAREEFKKLTQGDEENTKLWQKFTSISITETNKKLKLLQVGKINPNDNLFDFYNIGESFYEGLGLPRPNGEDYPDLEFNMKSIVAELIEKGVATQNEDGSVGVVFAEESKIPSCILQKKDGTGLYLTSDLAAIKYRLTNGWNPAKLIYSVDVRQQLHLKQAFAIAKMAWPELTEGVEFFHAFNGFIKLKEGAMSTRHGTVIFLDKLIEEGNERTTQILEEKGRTGDKALRGEDIQAITVAAIKYSYLAQDREKDVTFDWDKALAFEGNSGPYIQYAYVRATKIATTSSPSPFSFREGGSVPDPLSFRRGLGGGALSPHDKTLIQSLAGFRDAVDTTAKTYKPHHIALYAYSLAVTFNGFYVHTPKILEEENNALRDFRLSLVHETAATLKKAFELLGIEMPNEM